MKPGTRLAWQRQTNHFLSMASVTIKRIYDPIEKEDGFRVLADRLWPRGIKKEAAQIDLWIKEIAPSTALRKWFNHDTNRWPEFIKKYTSELNHSAYLQQLESILKEHKKITLVYSAKNEKQNQAVVLKDYLENKTLIG